MSVEVQDIRSELLSNGDNGVSSSGPGEAPSVFSPWGKRHEFVEAVLAMGPGDTLQDVLSRVDPKTAEEREADLAHRAHGAAASAASAYVANLAIGQFRDFLAR